MNQKKNDESLEFKRFERTVETLMQVPHAEIKEKLEAEKAAKRRKKSKKSSASREEDNRA
jgi:hypothetical protein